jgi:hypothetical protein
LRGYIGDIATHTQEQEMSIVTPAQREPELGDIKAAHLYHVELWLKGGNGGFGKRCFNVNADNRATAGRIAVAHCAAEDEAREVASVNMIG